MNAEFLDGKPPPGLESEQELASALVAVCGLTSEDVQKISETMQSLKLTFSEAAVHIGRATRADVEFAQTSEISRSGRNPGLIETVVRRISNSRAVVVREAPAVKPSPLIPVANDPYSPHAELIRALRTELVLRCPPTGKASVIAVLSNGSGEGRSQLAAELALSYAQLGGRTLLIDADFRNPRQHVLFECDNLEGLSQAIQGSNNPAVHRVEGVPHLWLLTSGSVPPNPLELLSDGRFGQRMMRWRDHHEVIIIDTPPTSEFADALAVAAISGRVLLLARGKRTTLPQAREVMRRLVNTQAEVVGAVVNYF